MSDGLLQHDAEKARNDSTAMSHEKLRSSSSINYSSVSSSDDFHSSSSSPHSSHDGHSHGRAPPPPSDFRVDIKDNSADPIIKPASSSSKKRNGKAAKGAHAHFENDDQGSHEHGGYHYGNGHPHSHAVHSSDASDAEDPSSPSGPRISNGGRSLSPVASPRASPRACGGLGPRAQRELDTAGRKVERENAAARRKLWIVSGLCLCFMTLEIIGGFIANSLAIMTDAAHLLSDLASFLISIFALWLATRAPTSRLSFGFHRAEILGALISVIMIWLLTGVLVYEAVQRIREPEVVDGRMMFIVASCGLLVNLVMGLILYQSGHQHSHGLGGGGHGHSHGGAATEEEEEEDEEEEEHGHSHHAHGTDHGHAHKAAASLQSSSYQKGELTATVDQPTHRKAANINVSAAFVHVLGDALQSVGVMIAAGLIWYSDDAWSIADPICTFIFSVLVLFTTARLVKQSVGVLMEGAPEGIDPAAVEEALHTVEGVLEVHDLHVWSLSVGKPSMSVHLLTTDNTGRVLREATLMLGKKFNIHHSTIQVEKEGDEIACNDHWK